MARILDQLLGHRDTVHLLLDAYLNRRLASTMLFVGPSGVGKRMAALGLAQVLLCEQNGETSIHPEQIACGQCGSCIRVASGQSESVMLVEPEGAQIKTEQARDVLSFLSLRALGRARVVIIDQAHLLNVQAANILLKSLEEPPSGTYFILISHASAGLLATIRSRSQMIRFRPFSDKDLRQLIGPQADDWVVLSARGSLEDAKRLMDHRDEFIEIEDAVQLYLRVAVDRLPSNEVTVLKDLMKERSAQSFVSAYIQSLLRDVMKVQGGVSVSDTGRSGELLEVARDWAPQAVRGLVERALEFEQDLNRNVDRSLVLENFAIYWRQAAHR
jgi:DNA polymerase-3 subunit delta'